MRYPPVVLIYAMHEQNYILQAVVPSVAWDFLFDKHIHLPNLPSLPNQPKKNLIKKKFLRFLRLLVLFYIVR